MSVIFVESHKQKLESYFKTWKYSFFSLHIERIRHLDTRRFEDEMYCDEANIGAAVILLKKENQQDALQFIKHCLKKDPTNIHAWCNKGMYHLSQRPADIDSAQEAKDKMDELLKEEEPRRAAIVEAAHWLYVMDGSAEQKEKALAMFDSVLRVVDTPVYPQHYAYIKVLTNKAKTVRQEDDATKKILQKLAQQFTIFSQSEKVEDEFAMWSFLADVLLNHYCRTLIHKRKIDLSSVQNLPQPDRLSAMYCAEKLLEIQKESTGITLRSSDCSRIGKIFLNLASNESDVSKRKELLNKAFERASRYESIPANSYEHAPRVCAQIIFHQWAMSYCADKREVAERCYRKMYNSSGRELII